MKKILIALILLKSHYANSQQPTQVKTAAKPSPDVNQATQRDTLLCKAWKLVSIEQFSVANKPDEKQKNDGITCVLDGTAFLIQNGETKTGKWQFDKTKTNITLELDNAQPWAGQGQQPVGQAKEKYRYKIITLTADQLIYEYQDPELIRIKYSFVPLKK